MTKTEAIEVLKGFVLYAEKVKSYTFLGDENIPIEALNMAIEALEQKPIIRCKDCTHAKPFLERYHCNKLDEDWEISFGAEHYCSFAERRESDEEA